jgi:DNA-binding beta-propeller fold protein YncE/mono/diheme cytochrome c family protein
MPSASGSGEARVGGDVALKAEGPVAAPDACAPVRTRTVNDTAASGSSVQIASIDGTFLLFVADEDHKAIHTIDVASFDQVSVTPLPGAPVNVLVLPDGRIAATLRDRHELAILELAEDVRDPLVARCTRPTSAEPWGLALSHDQKRLFVSTAWEPTITSFDVNRMTESKSIVVQPEPRGVAASNDGKYLYVTHMRGGIVSRVALADDKIDLIHALPAADLAAKKAAAPATPPKPKSDKGKKPPEVVVGPESASQGFGITLLGEASRLRVFAPMASSDSGRFELIRFPSSYGGGGSPAVHEPFVSVIDHASGKAFAPNAFGNVTRPSQCLLPRAVATYAEQLVLVCMGRDTVELLDSRVADPSMVVNDVIDVPSGPTGVAVDAPRGMIYAWSQFAGQLTKIDLALLSKLRSTPPPKGEKPGAKPKTLPTWKWSIALAHPDKPVLSPEAAQGRALFYTLNDSRLAGGLRACASCHPDGRGDGLVWTTPDGPRQTIFLAGRTKDSAPFGWFGDHPTLETHVRFTMKRLGGLGLEETRDKPDLRALLAYVDAIPAPPRSTPNEAEIAARKRGEAIFTGAGGCATCHVGGVGTDRARHDVGTGDAREASLKFDTPSLLFVRGSAPYMHDGRYATLMDLLRDPKLKMGALDKLTEADREALVAYMESL